MKIKLLFIIIIYIFLAAVIYFFLNDSSLIGIDDANIYFVYMKNLANDYGFVFNINGERVEGFTSLLWTLLGGLFFKIFSQPNLVLILTNIILIGIILYKLNNFFNRIFETKNFSKQFLLLLGLLLVIPGFFEWTILSLLETGLWSFLLILFSLQVLELNNSTNKLQYYIILSCLICLMVITRPESMLWAPFFIVFNGLREYLVTKNFRKVFLHNALLVVVFALSLFLLINWRIDYFGFPFPNTYYAKVSKSTSHNLFLGLKYIGGFLLYNPLFLIILVINTIYGIKLLLKQKMNLFLNRDYFSFIFLFSIFLLTLAIPLYTGGDYFANYRFMQPTIPLIIASVFFTDFGQKIKLNALSTSLAVVAVYFTSFHNYTIIKKHQSKLAHEFVVAKKERFNSQELNKLFSPDNYPTQGVMAAGGCGFVYNGKTMDMLGLNYVKMAHAKKENNNNVMKNHASFSKEVFFEDEPDLFWIAGDFADQDNPNDVLKISDFNKIIFKEVQDEPKFKDDYANCVISRKGYAKYLRIYAKKCFLEKLDKKSYTIRIVS